MKDDVHISQTHRADRSVGDEGRGVPVEDGVGALSGRERRVLFGYHRFDLGVVERVAKRYLGYEGRLDLLDEVVSDATDSLLFKVPDDHDIDDPDGYAASTTRRQVARTLQAEQKRKDREKDWVDEVQIMREVAKIRLATDHMVNSFLVAMHEALTGRQREICFLVLAGRSFKEVSALLKVDRKTVYNDLKRLYRLFQEFCDNFDPDDYPPEGRGPDVGVAPAGIDPYSGRRMSSSDLGGNRVSDGGATSASQDHPLHRTPHRLITVSVAVARRGVSTVQDGVRTACARQGALQEFKRLLLDLPAFRGLHLGGRRDLGDPPEARRCDSFAEIVEQLRT